MAGEVRAIRLAAETADDRRSGLLIRLEVTARRTRPSKRKMKPRSASHSSTALSISMQKTDGRSKAERLMTLITSAVAASR